MSLGDMISATLVDEYAVPVLDAEIRRQQDLPNFREEGFHPSEVGGVCPRLVVLNRIMQTKRERADVILQRIWNDGHAFHHWYQNMYFGPAGVLYGEWVCSRCKTVVEGFMPKDSCECQEDSPSDSCEMAPAMCAKKCGKHGNSLKEGRFWWRDDDKCAERGGCVWCGQNNVEAWGTWEFKEPRIWVPELGLVGKCDGLIFLDGKWYVLEIKTINTKGFQFLKGPSVKYLGQGATYHYAFKQMPEPYSLAEAVLFFYVNKNEALKSKGKQRKEKEFPVYWSQDSEDVIDGVRLMKSSIEEKSLPPMISECSQTRRNYKCDQWSKCSMIFGTGQKGWAAAEKMKAEVEVE